MRVLGLHKSVSESVLGKITLRTQRYKLIQLLIAVWIYVRYGI